MLQVRVNKADGPVLSEIQVPKNSQWTEVEATVRPAKTGIQTLYVSLKGSNKVEVDWISFK